MLILLKLAFQTIVARPTANRRLALAASNRFDFRQQVAEFAVVDFYAVIEVEFDALVGVVTKLFVELLKFLPLFDERVSFLFQRLAVTGVVELFGVHVRFVRSDDGLFEPLPEFCKTRP